MQLKATCFYFTVLLSLLITNSVCASPADISRRDLVQRDESTGTDVGQ